MFSKILKVIVAANLILPSGASADVIELRADSWCPYNCEPNSEHPGYMIEVANEALAQFGHTVNYQILSWARSLHQAENGEIDGVIGAIPDEAPDFIFGQAIGTYEDVVAFRSGEARNISDIGSFDGLRLGAINGYEYFETVSAYLEENSGDRNIIQYASGDNALAINLRKLVAGRVDVVAEVKSVLQYSFHQLGIADRIDLVSSGEVDEIFIAFSPATPNGELYARQLDQGLAELKKSGRYAEILAKYGLDTGDID